MSSIAFSGCLNNALLIVSIIRYGTIPLSREIVACRGVFWCFYWSIIKITISKIFYITKKFEIHENGVMDGEELFAIFDGRFVWINSMTKAVTRKNYYAYASIYWFLPHQFIQNFLHNFLSWIYVELKILTKIMLLLKMFKTSKLWNCSKIFKSNTCLQFIST